MTYMGLSATRSHRGGHWSLLARFPDPEVVTGEPGPDGGTFPLVQPGPHVEYHSVPEIVINRDGPEERRIAFVDDFGGTMQLSTQQLRNLIALLVSEDFWLITGL
jgi:hypothetical protein